MEGERTKERDGQRAGEGREGKRDHLEEKDRIHRDKLKGKGTREERREARGKAEGKEE